MEISLTSQVSNLGIIVVSTTFSPKTNFSSVLVVRGTSNSWDLFTDAQLWSAAGLLQILRFVIPVGQSFTSVFQYLIYLVTRLQSVHLREVSYYRDVSSFVQFTKMNIPDLYAGVALTGHSLGTHAHREASFD